MASCNIRNVDPELLKRLKVAAAEEGITLRQFVIEVLEEAVKKPEPKEAS